MERWNPNLFLREGQHKGYDHSYLAKLVEVGRRLSSQNVPVIYSLGHLAKLSKSLYVDLHAVVARDSINDYKNFTISKRSGGKRWISIPKPSLHFTQSWINREILSNVKPHLAAFAYVGGLTSPIKKHASNHCSANWILKLDISNFFSNISEFQVYEVFESLGYPKLLSFEMARLCTRTTPRRKGKRWNIDYRDSHGVSGYYCRSVGSLPQGAPTSPALSNLVCRKMDAELGQLAGENNFSYSRYADDLCFSSFNSNRNDIFLFKKKVCDILHLNHFSENKKKTRIIPPGARKIVTGLIVNEDKPSLSKEYRDRIRMHLHYAEKIGIPQQCRKRGFKSVIGFRNHLWGLILYANSIDSRSGAVFIEKFNNLPWLDFEI